MANEEELPAPLEEPEDTQTEIDEADESFIEPTRYSVMSKLIDKHLVEYHTKISKRDLPKIMQMRNWVRIYRASMRHAMEVNKSVKAEVEETSNFVLMQIIDYMNLKVAEEGSRATELFKTLRGEEKNERKWGIFSKGDSKEKELEE